MSTKSEFYKAVISINAMSQNTEEHTEENTPYSLTQD